MTKIVSLAVAVALLVLLVPVAASASAMQSVSVEGVVMGETGTVDLEARAHGRSDRLRGSGLGFHREFESLARFGLEGVVDRGVVRLWGTVSQAAAACLIGTPVTITADASTGEIGHTLGPVACPGPVHGQTLTFAGMGTVLIKG